MNLEGKQAESPGGGEALWQGAAHGGILRGTEGTSFLLSFPREAVGVCLWRGSPSLAQLYRAAFLSQPHSRHGRVTTLKSVWSTVLFASCRVL